MNYINSFSSSPFYFNFIIVSLCNVWPSKAPPRASFKIVDFMFQYIYVCRDLVRSMLAFKAPWWGLVLWLYYTILSFSLSLALSPLPCSLLWALMCLALIVRLSCPFCTPLCCFVVMWPPPRARSPWDWRPPTRVVCPFLFVYGKDTWAICTL